MQGDDEVSALALAPARAVRVNAWRAPRGCWRARSAAPRSSPSGCHPGSARQSAAPAACTARSAGRGPPPRSRRRLAAPRRIPAACRAGGSGCLRPTRSRTDLSTRPTSVAMVSSRGAPGSAHTSWTASGVEGAREDRHACPHLLLGGRAQLIAPTQSRSAASDAAGSRPGGRCSVSGSGSVAAWSAREAAARAAGRPRARSPAGCRPVAGTSRITSPRLAAVTRKPGSAAAARSANSSTASAPPAPPPVRRRRRRDWQGRDQAGVLAEDVQRLAARREQRHPRRFPQHRLGERRARVDEVLARVQDQQHPLVAQVAEDRLIRRAGDRAPAAQGSPPRRQPSCAGSRRPDSSTRQTPSR